MVKSSPHILIVDNDTVTLNTIDSIFKKLGYKTTLAQDGKEAIRKANSQLFDLIISDLHVPLLDGSELVKKLRNTPEYRYTPYIFLSKNDEEETWIKCFDNGGDDIITKPIKENILISKIKSHLKKSYLYRNILDSTHRNNISFEHGSLIYCADRTKPYALSQNLINTTIKTVYTQHDFFITLQDLSIWGIIIDENATWATEILEKITEIVSHHIPITILIADYSDQKKIDKYIDCQVTGLIPKNINKKILTYQINSKIKREIDLKNKYLTALNAAAKRSPIRFENEFSDNLKDYFIDILHQPFDKLPGGDYYETFNVGEHNKILILGDVMGKKWDAWFVVPAYIAYIRSTINFFASRKEIDVVESPGKFLEIINQYIFKDSQLSEVFSTLCIIVLCTRTSRVSIASAGALRPFYYNKNKQETSRLNVVGTLMGVKKDVTYKSLIQKFHPGDKLLFFTDGYVEVRNKETGKMIGDSCVLQALEKNINNPKLSPKIIEKQLMDDFNISKFDDDRTMMLIHRD